MLKAPDLRPLLPVRAGTARRRRATPRIADPRNARAAAGAPLFTPAPRPAGKGTPTSGQSSRWGPAQRPAGPRRSAGSDRHRAGARTPPRAGRPTERRSPTGIARERETPPTHARRVAQQRQQAAERRSPTGIARERETCTNDAGPSQRESRTTSCGRGEPTRSCGFLPVEASGRNRPPEAGEGLAFHPHVGRTPGEPHGPAPPTRYPRP